MKRGVVEVGGWVLKLAGSGVGKWVDHNIQLKHAILYPA
jgi:hypothetical protein